MIFIHVGDDGEELGRRHVSHYFPRRKATLVAFGRRLVFVDGILQRRRRARAFRLSAPEQGVFRGRKYPPPPPRLFRVSPGRRRKGRVASRVCHRHKPRDVRQKRVRVRRSKRRDIIAMFKTTMMMMMMMMMVPRHHHQRTPFQRVVAKSQSRRRRASQRPGRSHRPGNKKKQWDDNDFFRLGDPSFGKRVVALPVSSFFFSLSLSLCSFPREDDDV